MTPVGNRCLALGVVNSLGCKCQKFEEFLEIEFAAKVGGDFPGTSQRVEFVIVIHQQLYMFLQSLKETTFPFAQVVSHALFDMAANKRGVSARQEILMFL